MIHRWRSLRTPETLDRMRAPTTAEAAASWFFGTAWLSYGLWLAWHGRRAWVPIVLLCGMFALWGWKRRGWAFWFPVAAVLATLADTLWPTGVARHRPGSFLDLVVTGMALVIAARIMARGWPSGRRPLTELVMVVALLSGALLALLDPRALTPAVWRLAAAGTATVAAAAAAARRPQAYGRPWLAFPVAAGALGVVALIAFGRGEVGLRAAGPGIGPFLTLACALPLAWAMAVQRGGARAFHLIAAAVGSAGLAVEVGHFADGLAAAGLSAADPRLLVSVGAAMLTGSKLASGRGAALPGRMWIVLTIGVGVLAVVQGEALTAPLALMLTAIAVGLALGAGPRAGRPAIAATPRARRSWSKAA